MRIKDIVVFIFHGPRVQGIQAKVETVGFMYYIPVKPDGSMGQFWIMVFW